MEFKTHVKIRHERFGAVIFETLDEKVFVTNHTGSRILSLLEKGKESEEVVDELAKIYNSDRTIIKKDVNEFILKLKDSKLLKG